MFAVVLVGRAPCSPQEPRSEPPLRVPSLACACSGGRKVPLLAMANGGEPDDYIFTSCGTVGFHGKEISVPTKAQDWLHDCPVVIRGVRDAHLLQSTVL